MAQFQIWERLLNKYPQLENYTPVMIWDRLQQLAPRERYMILGAVGLICFMVIFLGIQSGTKKIARLERKLESDKKILAQILGLSSHVRSKKMIDKEWRDKIRDSGSGFYLGTYVENQALRYKITPDKIGTESRQDLGEDLEEISLDVKISKIPFPLMLTYLSQLEDSKKSLIRIKRIRLKTIPNDLINVDLGFKISTYMKK